jgi:hypothetical protein
MDAHAQRHLYSELHLHGNSHGDANALTDHELDTLAAADAYVHGDFDCDDQSYAHAEQTRCVQLHHHHS